jgi:hypothetical protein
MVTPALNFCVKPTGAAGGTCGQCGVNSDCMADGAKAFCDPTTHVCRGCLQHSECDGTAGAGAGLCYRPNDYPAAPANMLGRCVPNTSIAYLSNNAAGCENVAANPSSLAKPYCTLALAIASGKPFIKALPSPTPYPAINITMNQTVTLIGPGRDASPAVTFPSVMFNSAGTLSLSDIAVSASAGTAGVLCDGNGTLNLIASSVVTTVDGVTGVEGKNCTLNIERTRVQAKQASAIVVGKSATTTYRIINSAIVSSGSNFSGIVSILLEAGASGVFNYNTVTRNELSVFCGNQQELANSILMGNNSRAPSAACKITTSVIDESVGLDSNGDPKLLSTAANRMLVIDQGTAPAAASGEVATDFFGNLRPIGKGWDKGFHELQ